MQRGTINRAINMYVFHQMSSRNQKLSPESSSKIVNVHLHIQSHNSLLRSSSTPYWSAASIRNHRSFLCTGDTRNIQRWRLPTNNSVHICPRDRWVIRPRVPLILTKHHYSEPHSKTQSSKRRTNPSRALWAWSPQYSDAGHQRPCQLSFGYYPARIKKWLLPADHLRLVVGGDLRSVLLCRFAGHGFEGCSESLPFRIPNWGGPAFWMRMVVALVGEGVSFGAEDTFCGRG